MGQEVVTVTHALRHPLIERVGGLLFGRRARRGLVFNLALYALLVAIGFVYLQPLLFMFVTCIKSPAYLLNPIVQRVPSTL